MPCPSRERTCGTLQTFGGIFAAISATILTEGGDEKAHQAVVEAFLGLLLGLAVMGLSSCRTAPVITTDASYTPADVGKAVMSAGSSLGRQMTKIGPRMIEGTLFLQSHMA
jgi:hypothetical protein